MHTVVSLKNRHNHIVACANGFAFAQHEADNGAISGSETPGGDFPATRVEMNADDAGSVRPICDGSSLDKIEIAIGFSSQETPSRFPCEPASRRSPSLRILLDSRVRSSSFDPPAVVASLGELLLRVFSDPATLLPPCPGSMTDGVSSASEMPKMRRKITQMRRGAKRGDERSFVWFNNFTLHNILPADFKVIEHGLDIDPPILAVQIPNSRSTQENGDAFGG